MLSIVCPIYNEEKYIVRCIDSILSQDYPKDDLEVLFIDGMSSDRTYEIVEQYAKQYSYIHLLRNPKGIVPTAMNIGIKAAKGDVIIRLDAHCDFPTDYFSRLVYELDHLNADNVGAVCETKPCNNTTMAIGIAKALSCSFGMGNSQFRIGCDEIKEVDTVPFGCFHKRIFDEIGLYDEELIRNQDDELNARIINNGGKIYLIPDLVVKYYARDTLLKTWKMFYQYGLYKPLVNKKLGKPATIRQFFPLFFVLGLVFGWLIFLVSMWLLILYFAVILTYLIIGMAIGAKEGKRFNRMKLIFIQPIIFLSIHIGYGWGYIIGTYKILTRQSLYVKSNR